MVSLLWLALGVAEAACPSRVADLQRPINEAQAAFASMDDGAMSRASAAAESALGCLGEPISAASAASVHRHEALVAFLHNDPARARAAFRSALVLQPSYRLPEDVAPPGNPLATLYDEARALGPGPEEPVFTEPGLTLLVDGATSTALPSDRPVIVQVLSGDGAVLSTTYLQVGADLPAGLRVLPADPGFLPPPPPKNNELPPAPQAPARRPVALLAAGGGALVASGAMLTLSAVTQARYLDLDTPTASLDGLVQRNHAAVLAAGGLGAVGLGLGAVALVRW